MIHIFRSDYMLKLIKNEKLRRVLAIVLALAIVVMSVISYLPTFWN